MRLTATHLVMIAAIFCIALLLWLFRYDVVHNRGTDVTRLDRWTGKIEYCTPLDGCAQAGDWHRNAE